VNGYMKK